MKLTRKKLSTEANSHIDRSFHRGNCDSDGGSTNGVTILLHCDGGDSSLRCCSFLGFLSITGCEEYRREAARIVHAREGRLLLVVGRGAGAVVSSLGSGAGISESGSGEGDDRWAGREEGDP